MEKDAKKPMGICTIGSCSNCYDRFRYSTANATSIPVP